MEPTEPSPEPMASGHLVLGGDGIELSLVAVEETWRLSGLHSCRGLPGG